MLFDRTRPHAFRQIETAAEEVDQVAGTARREVERRASGSTALETWAVHRSTDGRRVIVVEAWRDPGAYLADPGAREAGAALYRMTAAGGSTLTPVTGDGSGVIIIDLFAVWRPLVRLVAAFNARNGEAMSHEPGCRSITVLRGLTTGGVATYARWRSVADFTAACSKLTGRPATTTSDVNSAGARLTLGLIRPDYHAYALVASSGEA